MMVEKTYQTSCGTIHYWVNPFDAQRITIAFLPGLTADHRLFEKQIEFFADQYNVFVWDAPGHGFRMLAEAMEANLPYRLPEHSLLICGEKDRAGSCIRYNRKWHEETGIRLEWIKNAGHNSNTDEPDVINSLIEKFVEDV